MAEPLTDLGQEVHIVAPYHSNALIPKKEVVIHRFSVPPIAYRNIVGQSLIMLAAWRVLRNLHSLDVFHAPEYLATGVIGPLTKLPTVLTVPGNVFERLDNVIHVDRMTAEVYKIMARRSAGCCARIIATSKEMQYWWEYSGAEHTRVIQIPLGVDTHSFRPRPDARHKLGFSFDKQIILFVGRLVEENGPALLLRAAAAASGEIRARHAELHFVGSGPDKAKLRGLCAELQIEDFVRWHGWVEIDDLPLYYSAATVFALPRLSRVTPRVLFQAMACQVPVVTAAIGGIEDFVIDGQTGFLVDPRDSEALAQRIIQLLTNRGLVQSMGSSARDIAIQRFDWRIVAKRVLEEVYSVL